MKRISITIKHSLTINRPPEVVWDYTQDYALRPNWDPFVLKAEIIEAVPNRIIRVHLRGHQAMVFEYKLNDRPNKTSLAVRDVHSFLIIGGGGSWTYENISGDTLWTQTNTLILKRRIWVYMILPLLKWRMQRDTRIAMQKAKTILEQTAT